MTPQILKLDVTGVPSGWIHWQEAAVLYARERVVWEAGQELFVFRGGTRANGDRSEMSINSIIATSEKKNRLISKKGPSSNLELFRRDGFVCLACTCKFKAHELSRDHLVPRARGGLDTWENLATFCRPCNTLKSDLTLEESGIQLAAVPYRPDPAAQLLLMASGRKITACQQAWLEATAKKKEHLH